MNVAVLLEELRRRDIELRVSGTRLLCSAPPGVLGPELQTRLRESKQEILDFLEAAQSLATRPPAIVPLQADGKLTPIFAAPGHNGDVFCFRALIGHLGSEQPFFGLQPPGLNESSRPLASIEELATYFAAQIRAFQPTGPYIIAGYCAGGAIAFELARQLIAQDASVSCTLLFGSPSPTWYGTLPQLRERTIEQTTRLARHARALFTLPWPELRTYVDDGRRRREARRADAHQRAVDPVLVRRAAVEAATLQAVRHYRPGYLAGRLCLILPNHRWRHVHDRWLGWPPALAAHTEEYCGSGDCENDEMLLAPRVAPFAGFLRRCLETAEPTWLRRPVHAP